MYNSHNNVAKYAFQKCAKAQGLLHMFGGYYVCGPAGGFDSPSSVSFCKMIHLAHSTLQMYNNVIHHAWRPSGCHFKGSSRSPANLLS